MPADEVYKIIEVVGQSPKSFADATSRAVRKAGKTLHGLGWFEVVDLRGRIEAGKVAAYQVTVKIGFRLDAA